MAVRRAFRAFVEAVGIDQRVRGRKQAGALVMVDDDHVELRRARFLERFERLCAAVDAERDRRAACLEFDQRLSRRAIALHQPVRDVDDRLGPQTAEKKGQQCRAGRSVYVIIAEDRDRLAALDRIGQPFGAVVHVLEGGGIGEEIADSRIAVPRKVVARHAASKQQLVDQRVHSFQRFGRPPPTPRLSGQRFFDVESKRHGPNLSLSPSAS